MRNLSRRSFLRSAAAAPAAASVPALALAGAEPELLALGADLDQACERHDTAYEELDASPADS